MKISLLTRKNIFCLTILFFIAILPFNLSFAQKAEETYSISLVKTAEKGNKEIHEIGDKKVLTETHTVKKGDWLWQVFREKGLLKKKNLPQLLSILKQLNSSLANLDLIHPGEKIIIPLTISPIEGIPVGVKKRPPVKITMDKIKDLKLENYTVKPGDSLVKVVKSLYNVSDEEINDEYLQMVKRLNPAVKDPNKIYPGQVIRLPVYSPQIVKMPIKKRPPPKAEPPVKKKIVGSLIHQLGAIFTKMGEEWVMTGEHFIPLKSGGEINLKAAAYPILNLTNGNKVIVDMNNDLPVKIAEVIQSNWDNYRIAHMEKDDDLRSALNKILIVCDYQEILGLGKPLEIQGDIQVRITADWIIKQPSGSSHERGNIFVITLTDKTTPKTPSMIKDYLKTLGIKAIDYPFKDETTEESLHGVEILNADNVSDLMEMLLDMAGQRFSSKVEIPVYQREKTGFALTVKADFSFNRGGKDYIIDLSGLGTEIISLLTEHQFSVLALSNEKAPSMIVKKTLDFLGLKSDSEPHTFIATGRGDSRNIRFTIPGTIFRDKNGQNIFATQLIIPQEMVNFLSQKGYKLLSLTLF